jgi:UDP-glucose 4-epimerase
MKVLVTGGLGFIGVNFTGEHVRRGHEVVIYDNFTVGTQEALDDMFRGEGIDAAAAARVKVVRGDICDPAATRAAAEGCDAIVHLAAHTNVIESVQKPDVSFRANASGTLNVLEAARALGIKRVVVASSNAAAGVTDPPVKETVVPRPISPYGSGKLAAEALASGYFGAYGIATVGCRFANVYGPYSLHKGSVVALFLKQVLRGESLVIYDGGRPTRDYIHVNDIVAALELCLEKGEPGGLYQIATGEETSVNQLVELVREVTGLPVKTVEAPARAGEITRNFSDISKARAELGFAPKVALRDGIEKLWPWFRRNFAPA